MRGLAIILGATLAAAAGATLAQDDEAQPTETVEEITDDAERGPDGLMQPETGAAEPQGSWFTCGDVESEDCAEPIAKDETPPRDPSENVVSD